MEGTSEEVRVALIQSMLGPLMNKVKLCFANPKKNINLAKQTQIIALVDLLAEQLIPQYCEANFNDYKNLNLMHNLCFLLAAKTQAVFNSSVIRTTIDQNWDLKGMRSVLIRIADELKINDSQKKIQQTFDKLIQSQNLQSQSCSKAFTQFLKNTKKDIEEDDLRNPLQTYQTTFQFLHDDIQQFRNQNMKHDCFTVLHPWAYDLDTVDFKYIISKDQVETICKLCKSQELKVFWLSFFKAQLSCSADEFINALREYSEMGLAQDVFQQRYAQYENFMIDNDFSVGLKTHSPIIDSHVQSLSETLKFNLGQNQIRLKEGPREPLEIINETFIEVDFVLTQNPEERFLKKIQALGHMKLEPVGQPSQYLGKLDLSKKTFKVGANACAQKKLKLKFVTVDTEELKNTVIEYSGDQAQFKVGEGDNNHYQITNDKKLWESQFMIVQKNGQYYIRDLGVVHTSRIKVEMGIEVQLQQGSIVDLGKVVHYHFDKATFQNKPKVDSDCQYLVFRPNLQYKIDPDPILRARPTWVSTDENKEMIQNEILLSLDEKKSHFSIGRSVKRDIELRLKAVSADHCAIYYTPQQGWVITEKGKDRPSSNGTFVFMKSMSQIDDHEPSDLIPLFNGMTISFINYELQVIIEDKDENEMKLSMTQVKQTPMGQPPQAKEPEPDFGQTLQTKEIPQNLNEERKENENQVVENQPVESKQEVEDQQPVQEEKKQEPPVQEQAPEQKEEPPVQNEVAPIQDPVKEPQPPVEEEQKEQAQEQVQQQQQEQQKEPEPIVKQPTQEEKQEVKEVEPPKEEEKQPPAPEPEQQQVEVKESQNQQTPPPNQEEQSSAQPQLANEENKEEVHPTQVENKEEEKVQKEEQNEHREERERESTPPRTVEGGGGSYEQPPIRDDPPQSNADPPAHQEEEGQHVHEHEGASQIAINDGGNDQQA